MPLFELGEDRLTAIEATTFAAAKVKERQDLQRLLRDQIEIIVPDGLVIAEEFSDWDDSRRSIDLLVLDRDANLIVVELKRTDDGGHMELQAIRYAAMVSTMTFSQATEAHAQYLLSRGLEDDARLRILDFLGWSESDDEEFGRDVRIVLASADFSRELTTAVLWLNERDIDIRCVRLAPYQYGDKTVIDVQQVIPLPEAMEYQVRVREKATQERAARHGQSARGELMYRFWSALLKRANTRLDLHQSISPSRGSWIAVTAHGIYYSYVTVYGAGRIEVYIYRPDPAENKAIFDDLFQNRSAIEGAFGRELRWQRLDEKTACRISAEIEGGSVNVESTWDTMHVAMVDGMEKFEAAMRPFVEKYRQGASPIAQ